MTLPLKEEKPTHLVVKCLKPVDRPHPAPVAPTCCADALVRRLLRRPRTKAEGLLLPPKPPHMLQAPEVGEGLATGAGGDILEGVGVCVCVCHPAANTQAGTPRSPSRKCRKIPELVQPTGKPGSGHTASTQTPGQPPHSDRSGVQAKPERAGLIGVNL